jgi:hypothetical protein
MRQRGRRSSVDLAVPVIDAARPRPEPPRGLTKAEQALFKEVVEDAPHLRKSDSQLLVAFVQATLVSRRSARDPARFDTWQKATRLQASLATKLRLSAQARIDPQTLGRQAPQRRVGQLAPWEL